MKNLFFLAVLLFPFSFSYSAINGNAFLENETDHSGIKIKFIPYSPSAELDSVYTSETGSYSISISPGVYTIEFSKESYFTQFYNEGSLITLDGNETFSPTTLVYSDGNNMAGSISGKWTNENIYYIINDVYIPYGDSLIIDAGTVIKIHSSFNFSINGLLKANGTVINPITITAEADDPVIGEWGDFIFENTASSDSYLDHCIFEYGNSITSSYTDLKIYNCEIQNFNTGIDCHSGSPEVVNSKFQNCLEYAIRFYYCNDLKFLNNEIWGHQLNSEFKGISVFDSDGLIEYNVLHGVFNVEEVSYAMYIDNLNEPPLGISNNIVHNFDNGIYCIYSDGVLMINNVIYNNIEYGIKLETSLNGSTLIQSNSITNNNFGIYSLGNSLNQEVSYNIVWGNQSNYVTNIPGLGQIITVNANGDPCDSYFNMSLNPHFVDPDNNDFHLFSDSYAIDAGKNDNVISEFDIDGNERILDGNNDGDSIVDIGGYEVPIALIPNSTFFCQDSSCAENEVSIEYTGNALGNSTFFWDFDGGTIIYGSDQGPYEIIWSVPGNKTISLYVQSGENFSDTSYHTIEINHLPIQASIPEGSTDLCEGSQNILYTTNTVEYAEDYLWELLPEGAGTIINNDTSAIINWSPNFSGQVYLRVSGENNCGEGPPSEMLLITITENVSVYIGIETLTNPICEGELVTFTSTTYFGGDEPIYQWQLNGIDVGSNLPEYASFELSQNDEIQCLLYSSELCPLLYPATSNSIIMEVNEAPIVEINSSPNDTACIDQSIVLDAGNSGAMYMWSTGENTQQITVNNMSGPSGGNQQYFVEVIDINSCVGHDTINIYFDPCTGIYPHRNLPAVEIYPNPTSDIVFINFNNKPTAVKIEVYSLLGKLMETKNFNNDLQKNRVALDLSKYKNGIYYVLVSNNDLSETFKIIKQ